MKKALKPTLYPSNPENGQDLGLSHSKEVTGADLVKDSLKGYADNLRFSYIQISALG